MKKTHPLMSKESMKWLFSSKKKKATEAKEEKTLLPFQMKKTRKIVRNYLFLPDFRKQIRYEFSLIPTTT